jgi:hypothetical protein
VTFRSLAGRLCPGVGVDSSEVFGHTLILEDAGGLDWKGGISFDTKWEIMLEGTTYTTDSEVVTVDEDLVLECSSNRAQNEWVAEEAGTNGARPAQVG